MTSASNDAPAEEEFSTRHSWFRKHGVSPVFFVALGVAAASLGCLLYLGVDWRIALYELARLFIINSDITLGQEATGTGAEVARGLTWVFRFVAPLVTASALYRFARELAANELCREESIQVITRMFRRPDFAEADASEHINMFQVDRLVRERFHSKYW